MQDQTNTTPLIPRADNFGRRLALLRSVLDLTQGEAAEKCGLKKPTWSYWEAHPDREPRQLLDVVTAISNGLNVDREWLLWGDPINRYSSNTHPLTSGNDAGEDAIPFRVSPAWWGEQPELKAA